MANLIERHAQKIVRVLLSWSSFDQLMLQGTLPSAAYSQAMATELDSTDLEKGPATSLMVKQMHAHLDAHAGASTFRSSDHRFSAGNYTMATCASLAVTLVTGSIRAQRVRRRTVVRSG